MLFYKICSNTILFFTSLCLIPLISVGCTSINTCCKTGSASAGSAILCPPTAGDIVGVRAASDAFYSALNEMFVGNITSMDNVWSHEDDVTQLGPMGGRLVGWESVGAEWRREAALKLGGTVSAEHVEVVAGPCMGFTVTDEVGQNMTANGKPIEVRFRATNIFRKEAGGWKMVHHHTDVSANLINATGEVK